VTATAKRVRPRGATVERAVLAATIEAMVAAGSARVSVEDIADRADVNKTTIYRRWPTLDGLIMAAVTAHADTSIPISDTGQLTSDLNALCRLVRDNLTSPTGRALLVATRPGDNRGLDEMRERFWTARFTAAAKIIERAVERGECPPMTAPELFIEQLVAPIHFRLVELGRPVDNGYITSLVEQLVRAVLPG
jgi:AcrR family transcriptional regulator